MHLLVWGCFHGLALMNNAALNIHVQEHSPGQTLLQPPGRGPSTQAASACWPQAESECGCEPQNPQGEEASRHGWRHIRCVIMELETFML